jgi:hypothetical protein
MEKRKLDTHGFLYPMPMVIVGADVGGRRTSWRSPG